MMLPVLKEITPDLAREILKFARNNNLTKRSKVEKYKRQMTEGKWRDRTGTPIKVIGGVLLDGRHRLMAISESGKSYNLPLIWK